MDKAQLILYGVATYLAIKSLIALMGEHRQTYKKKLARGAQGGRSRASAGCRPDCKGPKDCRFPRTRDRPRRSSRRLRPKLP